jgi:hypothetical protein
MPDHAGFAVAITVRKSALDGSLRRAYKTEKIGHFIRTQSVNLPDIAFPRVSLRLFFQPPEMTLSQSPVDHATLKVSGWGTVSVRMNPFPTLGETREIQWEARLVAKHEATLNSSAVNIKFKAENYKLFLWQFDILSGTLFSPEATAFLNGQQFKTQLESLLRRSLGDIDFPVDISFFGQLQGTEFLTVTTRSVAGALMVGIGAPLPGASGDDPALLHDFAGGNDIALYVNSKVMPLMLLQAQQQVEQEVAEAGATLEGNLQIACEEGHFRISGRASRSEGTANFSFSVVRQMVHTRPGKTLFTVKGPMTVRTRTWRALSFRAIEPSVDIDRDGWVIFGEVLAGILSLGAITVAIESFIADLAESIGGHITSANINQGGPIPLVRRSKDPVVRTAIEAFDIHADGVFVGITSQLKEPPALLSGMKHVPRNLAAHPLRYDVRLPFDAMPDDPFLRIRWTAIDLESGGVLVNEDGLAFNRQLFRFNPGSFHVQSNRFAVVCRVYRTLGPFSTELLNETFKLDIGPPLQPGAFVRWRYDVKNPQVRLNGATDEYSYVGDAVVRRWSKFHRTDQPCNEALDQSRYIYEREVRDELPFPIHDMVGNRYRLCDYCFFDGPGSNSSSL